jgi:hypothetical protein
MFRTCRDRGQLNNCANFRWDTDIHICKLFATLSLSAYPNWTNAMRINRFTAVFIAGAIYRERLPNHRS